MEQTSGLEVESLSPGSSTITMDRIESTLRDDTFIRDENTSGGIPPPLKWETFDYSFENGVHCYYTKEEQAFRRETFCLKLYDQAQDPEGHVLRLDRVLSEFAACNFQLKEPTQIVLDHTFQVLTRLPARPLELPYLPAALPQEYFNQGAPCVKASTAISWPDLQVTSYVSITVIRTALLRVIYSYAPPFHILQGLLDTIAELLEDASRLSSTAASDLAKKTWFIVRAFLWTSWQRCSMIYFSCILDNYLRFGYNDHNGSALILRGTIPAPGISIQQMSKRYASRGKARYMCGWAFELLRSDPISIGVDFRRFHRRYFEVFGDRPGRCLSNRQISCTGEQQEACQRFKGMVINDQSAHDVGCPGDCGRLTWEESSYRSVQGARAVALDGEDRVESKIKYCKASDKTLSISHVWSHGQGGRPEGPHGLNRCLHRRYISIAKSLECDSYWMDTPCIPEDHKLRAESISKINEVFEQSKATLICDKDLMDIDATTLSVKGHESILVTVMVCDWNVRAWTFLEAFRGRQSIYLLCKDNVVISFAETIRIVHRQGSLDIVPLLLAVPHMMAPFIRKGYHISTTVRAFEVGFLTVESSASLLSHRAATRPGDDIVIWSLLLKDEVFSDAATFWRTKVGETVNTGYLVSSAPRVGTKGFSWAPSSPSAQLFANPSTRPNVRQLAFDGMESEAGMITKDGLKADWLMYDHIGTGIIARILDGLYGIYDDPESPLCPRNINIIRKNYMKGYRWGALLRPIKSMSHDKPAPDRGDTSRTLVVVCASNNRFSWVWPWQNTGVEIDWDWKGVYEWDMTEPLPKFITVKGLRIV